MTPEALHLAVTLEADRLTAPRLVSRHRPSPVRALRGRTADDALSLIPLLYSLCGTAQMSAAVQACEQATGVRVAPPQRAARHALVLAETLGELSLGVLRDWSMLLDQPPRLDAARRLRTALGRLRGTLGDGPWHTPGGPSLRVDRPALTACLSDIRALLTAEVFGGASPTAPIHHTDIGPGPAQDMLRHLYVHGLESFGASAVGFLDGGTPDRPAETGPLARRAANPVVATMLDTHGNGLQARTVARLCDLAASLRDLEETAAQVYDHPGEGADITLGSGSGSGTVEAARGTLVHEVSVSDGRITDWRILAPTDWNFHPQGPLVRGLEGAPAGDDPVQRVRLLVAALDPCVACKVEVLTDA